MKRDKNNDMARRVARAVAEAGGRTFYVGGCVRDECLGRPVKDIDIEVHGVPVPTLEGILDALGERTSIGVSFGVMGLKHYDLDIAMPRSERSTGRGHRDFEAFVDPFIGYEKAARRRDFTMNALMKDVLTGELLDFFGGLDDLNHRCIRHVNNITFAEDPLRVFRAAQFAARFGFAVAPETTELAAGMDVEALASERVWGELEKALLKSEKPSIFFEALRDMRQLTVWSPEVEALSEPAWDRAMNALDAAARLLPRAQYPTAFLLSALCIEFDVDAAQRFLARLTSEVALTRYVLNMTQLRGQVADNADEMVLMALFDAATCPEDLLLLNRACGGVEPWDKLELYRARMAQPYVLGRDLVAAGVRPGPVMGEALKRAHALRLAGASKDAQLRAALEATGGVKS